MLFYSPYHGLSDEELLTKIDMQVVNSPIIAEVVRRWTELRDNGPAEGGDYEEGDITILCPQCEGQIKFRI